jgi:hypothetical protein
MAFMHRVTNAGGTLEREYAIGSGRMDLCLRYGEIPWASSSRPGATGSAICCPRACGNWTAT